MVDLTMWRWWSSSDPMEVNMWNIEALVEHFDLSSTPSLVFRNLVYGPYYTKSPLVLLHNLLLLCQSLLNSHLSSSPCVPHVASALASIL